VGVFSSTWRKKIFRWSFVFCWKYFYILKMFLWIFFRQILGIKSEEERNIDDPCSDEFYEYFRLTAKNNAQIYEEVFNTLPTDRIRSFSEVQTYVQRPKLKETDPLAVRFSEHFLLN
jgi:hypothetical protein